MIHVQNPERGPVQVGPAREPASPVPWLDMTSVPPTRSDEPWAMVSELRTTAEAASDLERAFRARLGEVDGWPGFLRLEVWADDTDPGRYLMTSWWETRESFLGWFRSDAHDRSHDRVPLDPAPTPVSFKRYRLIAT